MTAFFEDTGLGLGNLFYGVAQNLCVVKTNVGNDCHFRNRDDIGGIQRAAHANLQHHDVAVLPGKVFKADGSHQLELRRLFFHGFSKLPDIFGDGGNIFVSDLFTVYLHTLVEAENIGGGVKTCPVAGLLQNGGGHGSGAALAVSTGNVDKLQLLFWISHTAKQFLGSAQTGNAALPKEGMDIFNGFCNRHGQKLFSYKNLLRRRAETINRVMKPKAPDIKKAMVRRINSTPKTI